MPATAPSPPSFRPRVFPSTVFPPNPITPPRIAFRRTVNSTCPRFNEIERRSNVPPGQQRRSAPSGARRVFGIRRRFFSRTRLLKGELEDSYRSRGTRGSKTTGGERERGGSRHTAPDLSPRNLVAASKDRLGDTFPCHQRGASRRSAGCHSTSPFSTDIVPRRSTLPAGYRRETWPSSSRLVFQFPPFLLVFLRGAGSTRGRDGRSGECFLQRGYPSPRYRRRNTPSQRRNAGKL